MFRPPPADFLSRVSNRILELDRRNPGGLLSVAGDYATYLELKERTLEGAPLNGLIRLLNEARRAHPALQHLSNVEFLDTANDGLIAYLKRHESDTVLVVVSLDPRWAQEGLVHVHDQLGLPPAFQVQDLLDGQRYDWHQGGNYVRLVPGERQAHVLRVVSS